MAAGKRWNRARFRARMEQAGLWRAFVQARETLKGQGWTPAEIRTYLYVAFDDQAGEQGRRKATAEDEADALLKAQLDKEIGESKIRTRRTGSRSSDRRPKRKAAPRKR